jgi:hypothetical protein
MVNRTFADPDVLGTSLSTCGLLMQSRSRAPNRPGAAHQHSRFIYKPLNINTFEIIAAIVT